MLEAHSFQIEVMLEAHSFQIEVILEAHSFQIEELLEAHSFHTYIKYYIKGYSLGDECYILKDGMRI